ncbi:MAG: YceI family protein [Bryobacteraceae bacterium]
MSQYEIDPAHTRAHFKVRHLMVSNVRGEFSKVTGSATYDPSDLSSAKLEATIDASTVNTSEPQRDEHLKSPDFLDVAKFPTITFVSKSFAKTGADTLKVTGDLTIHGVTKEVVLNVEGPTDEVKDPWGNVKAGATATTKINRKDFGLTWNQALETGGLLVGEDITITLDVEFTRK